MAYYMQQILSCEAGGSGNTLIDVSSGALSESYINKAVTIDGNPSDLASPKVKLCSTNDYVLGSIIGYSYGRLQVVVSGWDVRFINSTDTALTVGLPILGANASINSVDTYGLIKVGSTTATAGDTFDTAEAQSSYDLIAKYTGRVVHGGAASGAGSAIVRVAISFGG